MNCLGWPSDVMKVRPFPALPLPHILPLAATVAAVTVNGREELVPDIGLFGTIAYKCRVKSE